MLVAVLDQSIVSPALPNIVGDLRGCRRCSGSSRDTFLASTIVVPIYGKLGDLIRRKGLFLQGVGGGGLMISAQSVLGDIVSPRERGRYMGRMMGMLGIGTFLGPLVGGS